MRLFTFNKCTGDKKTIPVDKWEKYEVTEDCRLILSFKGTPFKDETKKVEYKFENMEDLWKELNNLKEWWGK